MYPTTRQINISHPPPHQSHPPPHLAPQLSLNPSVPCNYLSSIIPLAAQLYVNTCPLLPHNKKPHNTDMCATITAWARLSPQREQDILEMERFALGKFADVVWLLVQLNLHRPRTRTTEMNALFLHINWILQQGEVQRSMTAIDHPCLNDAKFARATSGMRFHIYAQLLETYVGVLGIAEAIWTLQGGSGLKSM
ncbi:hypothetical protein BZA77DRAFT_389061 [Pyronema omphalodes]|nr:hypothetical protein BZA77DRAFT_389061 [Pyronema omphalodes]